MLYVVINPEIVEASPEIVEGVEGCLSIPGWYGWVPRARSIMVRGLNRDGRRVRIRAEGLVARVFQHEIDHLDGILFPDRITDPTPHLARSASPGGHPGARPGPCFPRRGSLRGAGPGVAQGMDFLQGVRGQLGL